MASSNQHLFGLFSAPFYIDMYSEDFGTLESCGKQSYVLPSDYISGLKIRPFFMIELNSKEINQTTQNVKFQIEKRRHFAIPPDVLSQLQMDVQTRQFVDEGITFMDSICSWKCWCVFLSKILCTKNEQILLKISVKK